MITTVRNGLHIILKLEGKLLEPWVEEFRDACARAEIQSGQVDLDLSDLTYADAAGTQLLRKLVQQGVPVTTCSAFVAELLR
jgi:anti-anti-sigma regulatory factor